MFTNLKSLSNSENSLILWSSFATEKVMLNTANVSNALLSSVSPDVTGPINGGVAKAVLWLISLILNSLSGNRKVNILALAVFAICTHLL